jgi:hypothetical protein
VRSALLGAPQVAFVRAAARYQRAASAKFRRCSERSAATRSGVTFSTRQLSRSPAPSGALNATNMLRATSPVKVRPVQCDAMVSLARPVKVLGEASGIALRAFLTNQF